MKNKGLFQSRFKDNPLEEKFARKWEAWNQNKGILKYLLDPNNRGEAVVTYPDRQVAATVIQWLGSPVGQDFLESVKK